MRQAEFSTAISPSIYVKRSSTYGGSSLSNQYPHGWQKEQRQAEFSTAAAPTLYAQRSHTSTFGTSSSSNQYPQGWQKEQRQECNQPPLYGTAMKSDLERQRIQQQSDPERQRIQQQTELHPPRNQLSDLTRQRNQPSPISAQKQNLPPEWPVLDTSIRQKVDTGTPPEANPNVQKVLNVPTPFRNTTMRSDKVDTELPPAPDPNARKMLSVPTPFRDTTLRSDDSTVINCGIQSPRTDGCSPMSAPSEPTALGIESTTENIPFTSVFPVGIVLSPFMQELAPSEIPRHDLVRCTQCFAYANPFAEMRDIQNWMCPFCANSNVTDYALEPSPQFTNAATDYVTRKPGAQGNPKKPCMVVVLDISAGATQSGALATSVVAIRKAIDELAASNPSTLISMICYDSVVYYFDLRTASPKAVVIPCTEEDLFVPDNIMLLPLEQAKPGLDSLLTTFLASRRQELKDNCFFTALRCASLLAESTGGNIVAMTSGFPSCGVDSKTAEELQKRQKKLSPQLHGDEQQKDPIRDFALKLNINKISVNAFVVTQKFCDLASMWQLTSYGGRIRYYNASHETLDALQADLHKEITRPQIYDCVMRVRCSIGWEIDSFYGPLRVTGNGLLAAGSTNKDLTLSFTLRRDKTERENSLANRRKMVVQVCTSYLDNAGIHHLRIATRSFNVNNEAGDCNANACATIAIHKAMVSSQRSDNVQAGQRLLQDFARNALHAGKRLQIRNQAPRKTPGPTADDVPTTEFHRLVYILFGLLRSSAMQMRENADPCIHAWTKLSTLPSNDILCGYGTPCLWNVQSLLEDGSPPTLPLACSSLDYNSAFLLFSGSEWLLWNGNHITDQDRCDVNDENNSRGIAVRRFVSEAHRTWLADRCPIYTIKGGDEPSNPWEYVFFSLLLEDAGTLPGTNQSYNQWVTTLAHTVGPSI